MSNVSFSHTGSHQVTPASLASGEDLEVSRIVTGRRAIIFARLVTGQLGVINVALDGAGHVERVQGVFRLYGARVRELDQAVAIAMCAFDAGA